MPAQTGLWCASLFRPVDYRVVADQSWTMAISGPATRPGTATASPPPDEPVEVHVDGAPIRVQPRDAVIRIDEQPGGGG